MGRIPVLVAWALCLFVVAFAACPEGQSAFGNCCYKLYKSSSQCSTDFSFNEANAFCQANGGQLVSIHSEAENKFVKGLIKHAQGKCLPQRDFLYWIGLKLSHGPDGILNGAAWTDGSTVDFGPLGNGFQPPFVKGAPAGSDQDAVDEGVCPGGNEKNCVQIVGFGHDLGLWRDANCSNVHKQANTCSQTATVSPKRNCTSPVDVKHDKYTKDDGKLAEFCRAEAATNGFICKFCGGSLPPTTTSTSEPTTTTTTIAPTTTAPTTAASTTTTTTTITPTTTTTEPTTTTTTPTTTTTTPTTTTTTPTTTTTTPTTTTTTPTTTTTTPTTTTTTAPTTTTTTTVPPPVVPLYACPDTRYPFPRCCGPLGVLCDPAAPPTGFICIATDRTRARCCGPLLVGGTGCVNFVEAVRIN